MMKPRLNPLSAAMSSTAAMTMSGQTTASSPQSRAQLVRERRQCRRDCRVRFFVGNRAVEALHRHANRQAFLPGGDLRAAVFVERAHLRAKRADRACDRLLDLRRGNV